MYALLSLLLFGLPILEHPRGTILGEDEIDSSQFMWFFGWWPHALLHGLNPFVTHHMFVPDGFNLQWATSMPLPSVLLAPVTLLAGPAVTWNLIQLAAPALSAWTAFLLCRHVTGQPWASLAGGYLFGFSPYMLTHLRGGPYLALVALIPLFVLLTLRRLEGAITPRRFAVYMTVALTAQYLISIEVLATTTLFGGAALALGFVLFPERRRDILDLLRPLAAAYAVTIALVSPFLLYFFFGDQYPPGATYFSSNLSGMVLPHDALAVARSHSPAEGFRGAVLEAYLGLPLLLLIVLFAWQRRRQRQAWLLVGFLIVALVASLGKVLVVRDTSTGLWMPWKLFAELPVLEHALPVRFMLFVTLAAAVIVALWLSGGSLARWALLLLVVVSFLPDFGNRAWQTDIADPPFFTSDSYKSKLDPADHVLTVPAWGPNQRWQANAKFDFKLAAGYAGNPFPPSYSRYPTFNTLLSGRLTSDYAVQLRRFVRDKRVTAVVVDTRVPGPWRRLFGALEVTPEETGGVLFYRLRPPPAARG